MNKQQLLSSIDFGKRVAEDEKDDLSRYFIETDQWKKVYNGDVDVIYGLKGSGKSALYTYLLSKKDDLEKKKILIFSGENPRGDTAFKDIIDSPPTSETILIRIWKIYFLTLIYNSLEEANVKNDQFNALKEKLESSNLIPKKRNKLSAYLANAIDFVKRASKLEGVETGVAVSPGGIPQAFYARILFEEPTTAMSTSGAVSVDDLYELANQSLIKEGFKIWILLDRLDVAFTDSDDLEKNAIRALFRNYLYVKGQYSNISLKIFLRTDIWNKITDTGFREASHIDGTKITWDRDSLLNLLMKRIISNDTLVDNFKIDKNSITSKIDEQEKFLYRLVPAQIETGANKPETFDWVLGRIRDGNKTISPRELIHFFSQAKEKQLIKFESKRDETKDENLFSVSAFKDAWSDVSEEKLTKYIYAEYADIKTYILKLVKQKATHTIETLMNLWEIEEKDCLIIIERFCDIGLFEKQQVKKTNKYIYSLPFVYRPSLKSIQGKARLP